MSQSNELEQEAREWINANRPEPAKCKTCGQPMPTIANAGAHSLAYCPTTGQGHVYEVTLNNNPDDYEAKRLAAFAAQVEERERERCAKIAETWETTIIPKVDERDEIWESSCNDVAQNIAAAIRERSRG